MRIPITISVLNGYQDRKKVNAMAKCGGGSKGGGSTTKRKGGKKRK